MIAALLAQMCEIDLTPPANLVGSVYVLMDGVDPVYVGQSINAGYRIPAHQYGSAPKKFDRAFRLYVPLDDMSAFEGALIRRLNPRDCGSAPKDSGRDAEILARLGLAPCEVSRAAFRSRQMDRWSRTRQARLMWGWRHMTGRLSSAMWRAALRVSKRAA